MGRNSRALSSSLDSPPDPACSWGNFNSPVLLTLCTLSVNLFQASHLDFFICLAMVAADGRGWFLGWAPICNEFPAIPLGKRLCTSLPAERMWDGSNCGHWGFLYTLAFLCLTLGSTSLQHRWQDPGGLGTTIPWTILDTSPWKVWPWLAACGLTWASSVIK